MLAATQTTTGDIVIWSLVLIGGIAVLGAVVWLIRRWALADPDQPADEWSLQHLRDMKADGRISNEEFQTLKAKLIKQYRGGDSQ
jgi:hypothetical protein